MNFADSGAIENSEIKIRLRFNNVSKCLAGEAGVPVVKFKNFRDKWVGSTEGNLEKIFRLLQALGRCVVFIDEADQALGRRGGGDDSSGVSGVL